MKKLKYFIPILLFAILAISCKKETNAYIDANAPAPAQVSDIKVEATPGGAIITYKVPADKNLYYVKAVYEIQPNVFGETKSSFYKDTLALVGFGDTLSYEVKIYSVGRNGKESTPFIVNVKPLTPSVKSVFETLIIDVTFGGLIVSFKNSFHADLSINVMVDTTGHDTWAPVTSYYTGALEGKFAIHGLDTIERKFAIFVRDRWNNKSDTLVKSMRPWFEVLIPKSPFKVINLPGDFYTPSAPANHLEVVWDGLVVPAGTFFAPKDVVTLPQWFTVDLNQNVLFSRMKLWQRTNYPYNTMWVKSFEIWGSNAPGVDGSWNNWQLLGKFESIKPSGLPDPNYTANDMVYENKGEDYIFPQPIPAVRYIRVKVLDTRGGVAQYCLVELTFWGQIK